MCQGSFGDAAKTFQDVCGLKDACAAVTASSTVSDVQVLRSLAAQAVKTLPGFRRGFDSSQAEALLYKAAEASLTSLAETCLVAPSLISNSMVKTKNFFVIGGVSFV